MPDDYEPDDERVQASAQERQHDRTDRIESLLNRAEDMLQEQKYPVTSEELATEYADETIDLPNETESLGSVFDRLVDERYESPEEAREAMYNEITGSAGSDAEFNDERDLDDLDEAAQDDVTDSGATDL